MRYLMSKIPIVKLILKYVMKYIYEKIILFFISLKTALSKEHSVITDHNVEKKGWFRLAYENRYIFYCLLINSKDDVESETNAPIENMNIENSKEIFCQDFLPNDEQNIKIYCKKDSNINGW